jgi:hypothetical protein
MPVYTWVALGLFLLLGTVGSVAVTLGIRRTKLCSLSQHGCTRCPSLVACITFAART